MNSSKRSTTMRALGLGGAAAVALGALGCATTAPSSQLESARDAYHEAANSEAADIEPEHVLSARQALQKAERAHEDEPQSIQEKHLAYLAERMAELAMARSDVTEARRRKLAAEQRYNELLAEQKRETQEDLDANRRVLHEREKDLAEERQARKGAQDRAEEAQQEREEAEQQLQKAQMRLEDALHKIGQLSNVKVDKRGVVITLNGSVLFEFGKAQLMPVAAQRLKEVAKALEEELKDEDKTVIVEGHTDAIGSDETNMELSRHRARSVREFLVSQGIDPNRIEAVGKGENQPVAPNDSAEGRANNRRVEIVIKNGE